MQPIAHNGFEIFILPLSGAMTGVKKGGPLQKRLCCMVQNICIRPYGFQLGEMETAETNIGLKPVGDVEDPSVGAAAEKDCVSLFFQGHIDLVSEILVLKCALFQPFQSKGIHRVWALC